ncbi:MAG: DUF4269 domain-containing protein [Rikenellaceae bacterium]|jgi:hypothetical protein|nr:DUF4269 domain-containing protein [Rikenellaceae bacterium]
METHFTDISYLATGNPRQRHCYAVLTKTRVLELLAPYGAVLAGTIPLGIDVPSSDLDVICRVTDFDEFARFARQNFGQYEDFAIRYLDRDRVVCGFFEEGEEVEIYGSPTPPRQTNGFRHMIIEARLLGVLGGQFTEKVRALRREGMKTEPAFAWLLGLTGDPYEAVRSLEVYSDKQLAELFI